VISELTYVKQIPVFALGLRPTGSELQNYHAYAPVKRSGNFEHSKTLLVRFRELAHAKDCYKRERYNDYLEVKWKHAMICARELQVRLTADQASLGCTWLKDVAVKWRYRGQCLAES
jgi:hypothetical protein